MKDLWLLTACLSIPEPEYFYTKDPVYDGPKRNGSITENFRNVTYYSDKV